MLSLILASLWNRKSTISVTIFAAVLLSIAMAWNGWLSTPRDLMHAGWILLLILAYAFLFLIMTSDRGLSAFFVGLNQWRSWCIGQIIAHLICMTAFAILWTCVYFILFGFDFFALIQAGIMMLFSAIFAQATFDTLQKRLFHLSNDKKYALMAVISGPWVLISWILCMIASEKLLSGFSCLLPVLALILLGISQTALSIMYQPK